MGLAEAATKKAVKAKAKPASAGSKKKATKPKSNLQLRKEARPKTPPSAYIRYHKEHYSKVFASTGSLADTSKKISEMWSKESAAVKSKFEQEYALAKAQHDKDVAEWKVKYPAPVSGYALYIKSQFAKAAKPGSKEESIEQMKKFAAQWSQLTPEEKLQWKGSNISS